jgi:hypothetical protein
MLQICYIPGRVGKIRMVSKANKLNKWLKTIFREINNFYGMGVFNVLPMIYGYPVALKKVD